MATINFRNEEAIKPRNEPKAALSALSISLRWIISPISAPKKGPIIIPKGIGDNKPTTRPIVVPIIPDRLPPNRLVPSAGII